MLYFSALDSGCILSDVVLTEVESSSLINSSRDDSDLFDDLFAFDERLLSLSSTQNSGSISAAGGESEGGLTGETTRGGAGGGQAGGAEQGEHVSVDFSPLTPISDLSDEDCTGPMHAEQGTDILSKVSSTTSLWSLVSSATCDSETSPVHTREEQQELEDDSDGDDVMPPFGLFFLLLLLLLLVLLLLLLLLLFFFRCCCCCALHGSHERRLASAMCVDDCVGWHLS